MDRYTTISVTLAAMSALKLQPARNQKRPLLGDMPLTQLGAFNLVGMRAERRPAWFVGYEYYSSGRTLLQVEFQAQYTQRTKTGAPTRNASSKVRVRRDHLGFAGATWLECGP